MYRSQHMVKILEISDSGFRKWCQAIESTGYSFEKNNGNKRIFTEDEKLLFIEFKQLLADEGLTLEHAAQRVFHSEVTVLSVEQPIPSILNILSSFDHRLSTLENNNEELKQLIHGQTEVMENMLKKHDEQLVSTLKVLLNKNKPPKKVAWYKRVFSRKAADEEPAFNADEE